MRHGKKSLCQANPAFTKLILGVNASPIVSQFRIIPAAKLQSITLVSSKLLIRHYFFEHPEKFLFQMEHLLTTEGLVSLLTLTFLEIVLGIDNVVFISIISDRVPAEHRNKARTLGIGLALVGRIVLLLMINWIIGLSKPLFTINDYSMSIRDLILIAGGLFLIGKSTSEIHAKLEGKGHSQKDVRLLTLGNAIVQIIIIDLVFSLDSILTAIGLVENVVIIVIAIVISLGVMLAFVKTISEFISRHPAMKVLAISFLIMIGTLLVVEGFHGHIPRGYIYFSMAFALGIEILNMKIRKNTYRHEAEELQEEMQSGKQNQ